MARVSVLAFLIVATAVGRTAPADTAAASLSEFFAPGIVFQDRNSDGAVDFVDARLVLGEQPSAAELAAAADVAARLGFETSAMDIPVVRPRSRTRRYAKPDRAADRSSSAPRRWRGPGSSLETIGGPGLKAGEGLVSAFTLAGRPAVAVVGDDGGLSSAAVMLGGHLPFIWDQKSVTTDKVASDVKEFLSGKGVTAASALASSVLVRDQIDGVERLVVEAADGHRRRSRQGASGAASAQGDWQARPETRLVVRERAQRADPSARAWFRRGDDRPAGAFLLRPPPLRSRPRARPGGGAKENFDLSSFYANDGALADSDNNLIPDRVDVLLSADGDGADGVVDLAARLGLESTGVALPIAKTAEGDRRARQRADPRPDRHIASGRRAADQEQQVGTAAARSRAKG